MTSPQEEILVMGSDVSGVDSGLSQVIDLLQRVATATDQTAAGFDQLNASGQGLADVTVDQSGASTDSAEALQVLAESAGNASQALGTATGVVQAASGSFSSLTDALATGRGELLATASTIGVATTAFATLGTMAGQWANEINRMSVMTGLSIENTKLWSDAMAIAGARGNSLIMVTLRLAQAQEQMASGGTSKATTALQALGVQAVDPATGSLKSMDELLPDVMAKLAAMGAGSEQTATAMTLFGFRGRELLLLLKDFPNVMAQATAEDQRHQLLIDNLTAFTEKYNLSLLDMKNTLLEVATGVGPAFASFLSTAANVFKDLVDAGKPVASFLGEINDKTQILTMALQAFIGVAVLRASIAFGQLTLSLLASVVGIERHTAAEGADAAATVLNTGAVTRNAAALAEQGAAAEGAAATAGGSLVPALGLVAVGLVVVNTAVQALTGSSLLDWMDGAKVKADEAASALQKYGDAQTEVAARVNEGATAQQAAASLSGQYGLELTTVVRNMKDFTAAHDSGKMSLEAYTVAIRGQTVDAQQLVNNISALHLTYSQLHDLVQQFPELFSLFSGALNDAAAAASVADAATQGYANSIDNLVAASNNWTAKGFAGPDLAGQLGRAGEAAAEAAGAVQGFKDTIASSPFANMVWAGTHWEDAAKKVGGSSAQNYMDAFIETIQTGDLLRRLTKVWDQAGAETAITYQKAFSDKTAASADAFANSVEKLIDEFIKAGGKAADPRIANLEAAAAAALVTGSGTALSDAISALEKGIPKLGATGTGFAASFFGRQSGGPVQAGMDYIVGERGPEVFHPGTSGTIIPNGAGGVNLSMSFVIQGNADQRSVIAFEQAAERVLRRQFGIQATQHNTRWART